LLLAGLDLRANLNQVRQPVLLICGDFDPLVGKDCEEELLRGLPSAERIEIPGCGHYPYFSHPEVLTEIIRMFLSPRTGC
jgi:pimeloyl-ACP methyl ester carboxylesterase